MGFRYSTLFRRVWLCWQQPAFLLHGLYYMAPLEFARLLVVLFTSSGFGILGAYLVSLMTVVGSFTLGIERVLNGEQLGLGDPGGKVYRPNPALRTAGIYLGLGAFVLLIVVFLLTFTVHFDPLPADLEMWLVRLRDVRSYGAGFVHVLGPTISGVLVFAAIIWLVLPGATEQLAFGASVRMSVRLFVRNFVPALVVLLIILLLASIHELLSQQLDALAGTSVQRLALQQGEQITWLRSGLGLGSALVHSLLVAPFASFCLLLWTLFYRQLHWDDLQRPLPERVLASSRFWFLRSSARLVSAMLAGVVVGAALLSPWSTVQLSDRLESTRHPRLIIHAGGTLQDIAFNPQRHLLATCSKDKFVQVWDVARRDEPGREVGLWRLGSGCTAAAFSPDGTQLALLLEDGTVRTLNLDDLATAPQLLYAGLVSYSEAIAYSPTGKLAASSLQTVVLLDPAGKQAPQMLQGLAYGLAFSNDGSRLAVADGRLVIWDLNHLDNRATSANPDGLVESAAFTSDDELWINADDNLLSSTDPAIGTPSSSTYGSGVIEGADVAALFKTRYTLPNGFGITDLAFSTDNRWIAAANTHGVYLLDQQDSDAQPERLDDNPIDAHLAFSGDNTILYEGDYGGDVYAWDLAAQ